MPTLWRYFSLRLVFHVQLASQYPFLVVGTAISSLQPRLVSLLRGTIDELLNSACIQTSVELQINRSPRSRRLHGGRVVSPYTTGTIHGNWELVFGKSRYKLLSLLPSTQLPPDDDFRKLHQSQGMVSAADSNEERENVSSMEDIV